MSRVMSQVTVNGPEGLPSGCGSRTCELGNNTLFTLPGGRWGVKLNQGAILFEDCSTLLAVGYDELKDDTSLSKCKDLPGSVEITYKPATEGMTDEQVELTAQQVMHEMNMRVNELFRKMRNDLSKRGLLPNEPSSD